jgi:hypothetical protein
MCEFEENNYEEISKSLTIYESLIDAYTKSNPDSTREEASMYMFSLFGYIPKFEEEKNDN